MVNGRFYGFEVKRPFIGVLSKMQEQTIKEIREAGGKAYVVVYPEDVERALRSEIKATEYRAQFMGEWVENENPCDTCENNQIDPCVYLEENDRSSCPKIRRR